MAVQPAPGQVWYVPAQKGQTEKIIRLDGEIGGSWWDYSVKVNGRWDNGHHMGYFRHNGLLATNSFGDAGFYGNDSSLGSVLNRQERYWAWWKGAVAWTQHFEKDWIIFQGLFLGVLGSFFLALVPALLLSLAPEVLRLIGGLSWNHLDPTVFLILLFAGLFMIPATLFVIVPGILEEFDKRGF